VNDGHHTRYQSLDILKGFIIITIVFLHLIFNNHETYGKPAIYLQILYLGLISFFIMSGYFYRPGRGIRRNLEIRTKQLFLTLAVCTVVLSAILFVWLTVLGYATSLDDYINALVWGFGQSNVFEPYGAAKVFPVCGASVGYYFLWTMQIAFIIFYLLAERVMDSNWKVAVTIFVLILFTFVWSEFVGIRLPFHADLAPSAAAFMFTGAWLARQDLVGTIERFEIRTKQFWLPFVICLVCGIGLSLVFNPDTNYDNLVLGDYGGYSAFPYYFEAVLMCVVYFYIAGFVSKVPGLRTVLSKFGEHTLGILLLHGFVASMIIAPFWPLTNESWFPLTMTLMERIAVALATLIISYVLCRYGPYVVSRIRQKKDAGDEPSES